MAIRIQLQTGKTVMVSSILDALDFDYQEAIANNAGYEINNPFSETIEGDDFIYEETLIKLEIPDVTSLEDFEELDLQEEID